MLSSSSSLEVVADVHVTQHEKGPTEYLCRCCGKVYLGRKYEEHLSVK